MASTFWQVLPDVSRPLFKLHLLSNTLFHEIRAAYNVIKEAGAQV